MSGAMTTAQYTDVEKANERLNGLFDERHELYEEIDRLKAENEKLEEHIFECCVEDGCDCGYEKEAKP